MTQAQLEDRVREHLGQEHRYEHSLRVAQCAGELALRHGVDAPKARLAGLLHDLARLYSPERLIAECESRDMPIDENERAHPMLLHARLGAALARELFGVEDDDVLSAIAKHTTGAPEMSARLIQPAASNGRFREYQQAAAREPSEQIAPKADA